ncbi:hypothetical protein [Methanopyrus sp. KOL6]|uniref:hypothetical protein n=1 Tax=Methanopyrus sp. KOL6 TaxID=1937004 RepID=UPI000B4BA3FC|nr:hypothetical protein [Methanopyrus sp. KOL6]
MTDLNLSLFRRDCRFVLEELGCIVEDVDSDYRLDFVVRSDDFCFALVCVGGLSDLASMSALGEWEEGLAEIARDAEALGLGALVVFPREPREEVMSVSAFCEHYSLGLAVTEWETLPLEVIEDPLKLDYGSATEVFLEAKLGMIPEWPDTEPLEDLLVGDRPVTPNDVVQIVKREVSLDWRDLVMRLRWSGYSGERLSEALYSALMSDEVEMTEDGELMHVPERLSEVLGALLVWLQNRGRVPEDEVYEFLFAQFGVPYDVTYIALKKLEERGEIEVKSGLVVARV